MKSLQAILALALLVAACATASPDTAFPTPEEPSGTPSTEEAIPAAIRDAIAAELGVAPDDLQVLYVQEVEWPDACLGIYEDGVACIQLLTPGYRVIVEANGQVHEARTDQSGNNVIVTTPALTWNREGGIAGFCDHLTVWLPDSAQALSCAPGMGLADGSLAELLTPEERDQFDAWLADFGLVIIEQRDPPVPDGLTVVLTLNGEGAGQPSAAEQQAMLEWAQALYERLTP